ncbi:hypothetical protein GCM10010399_44040 [Dactylosporangium fulvum]|uniref:Uncharacterized protein n=1 Tax=Dactylosporangium fulvum TaxID=53359 RepID=A0ABY5W8W6_9ACTN|nr:hypothetical protein [Dactylosporangium fulvum]UWP85929.1 hypothetical protein Dfulv_17420 [Dactylosporangium fulvum]
MNDTTLADLQAAIAESAEEYRQQIVAARCSMGNYDYAKNNGRAEATRETTTRMAEAAGLPVPDWDAIRRAVPADGIYR